MSSLSVGSNVMVRSALVLPLFAFSVFASAAPAKTAEKKGEPAKAPAPVPTKYVKSSPDAVMVKMVTSMGVIRLELDPVKAPVTVKNFLSYVNAGHYNKTIFHRVIDGFMIQGGGFDEKMKEKSTKDPIKNESKNGLSNARGTISMARTSDPDSATAQFFINLVDNVPLDFVSDLKPGYAVFGKVVEGMDVVSAIGKVQVGSFGMYQDVPAKPVVIESVKVEK
jgi:cyclophilin family peptidyl-prolyl cis-trans isomerase